MFNVFVQLVAFVVLCESLDPVVSRDEQTARVFYTNGEQF